MRLTVLGAHGSFPGADGACSGYLLEAEGQVVLLDCGNGVLGRLQMHYPIEDLDAVLISHLHFDHMADLLVLQYGLATKRALRGGPGRLPLHLPATPEHVVELVSHEDVFATNYIEDGELAQLGPLTVSFTRMDHPVESYAITVRNSGEKLVYSGDTAYSTRLVDAADGADLFLCEATGLAGSQPPGEAFPHLTARQAAAAAHQAGVRRLLLTHYWPEYPPAEYVAEARAVFPNTELAAELVTYQV